MAHRHHHYRRPDRAVNESTNGDTRIDPAATTPANTISVTIPLDGYRTSCSSATISALNPAEFSNHPA